MPEFQRALIAALLVTAGAPAGAAPVLRTADVRIAFSSPTECAVTMTMAIDGATAIEHRVDAPGIELIEVQRARRIGDLRIVGRTQALVVQPEQPSYELRYRARLSADRAHRCPVWLPAVPTDGLSRTVVIQVELPPGAAPGRSMPALAWTGSHGTVTLGHVPAFVHVPFAAGGAAPAWDIGGVMDIVALTVFALASGLWVWRRQR